MLYNYIKIAWRNLMKRKLFSAINLLGLVAGMAACLLISQYVTYENSYDSSFSDVTDIYRISHFRYQSGVEVEQSSRTFSGVSGAIKQHIPEVKEVANAISVDCTISNNSDSQAPVSFKEDQVFFITSTFLDVLDYPIISGTKESLDQPNMLVLTESKARKYFGDENPVGKTLEIFNFNQGVNIKAQVVAIIADLPANSHLQFDALLTSKDLNGWLYADYYTYIKLFPGTEKEVVETKLKNLVANYSTRSDAGNNRVELGMMPITDIHLYSHLSGEPSVSGNGNLVWFLSVIAVLILLIAYINYVNLSSVRALERAREVGIRKVFGSMKRALMTQFFVESMLINLIAVIVASLITWLLLPYFNDLIAAEISFTLISYPLFWVAVVVLLIGGGLASGWYPAYLLSGYKPTEVLKGKLPIGSGGLLARRVLVIFQFSISIALIICTFTIYKQVNYMRNKDLGFDMVQTLVVPAPAKMLESQQGGAGFYQRTMSFQDELLSETSIASVTSASGIPGVEITWSRPYKVKEKYSNKEGNLYPTLSIGPEFIDQFGLELLAGTRFPNKRINPFAAPPALEVMVNESAALSFGFDKPEDAVGSYLVDTNGSGRTFEFKIIGVLKDFHVKSLKEAVTPIIFRLEDGSSIEYFAIKLNTENLPSTIARVRELYTTLFPASPFEYYFLDEFFDRQYKADQQFGSIFAAFTGFAILIACLGLFGLSLYTSVQRTKEIGIRKTLGASIWHILFLLLKDFMKLLLIATLIAWPLSGWGLYEWLKSYPFRIDLTIWLFLIPTLSILIISVIVAGSQTFRVGKTNPIKALRYE